MPEEKFINTGIDNDNKTPYNLDNKKLIELYTKMRILCLEIPGILQRQTIKLEININTKMKSVIIKTL
jgi:hypothetical protein